MCDSCTEIVYAECISVIKKEKRHIDRVFDIQEIAFRRFAVFEVGPVRFKQTHLACSVYLLECLEDKASHIRLVIFVGAKDIEVFQADDFSKQAVPLRPQVKQLL